MLAGFISPGKSSNASTPTRMSTRSMSRNSVGALSPLVPRHLNFRESDFNIGPEPLNFPFRTGKFSNNALTCASYCSLRPSR